VQLKIFHSVHSSDLLLMFDIVRKLGDSRVVSQFDYLFNLFTNRALSYSQGGNVAQLRNTKLKI
jgi:hypothetical protein